MLYNYFLKIFIVFTIIVCLTDLSLLPSVYPQTLEDGLKDLATQISSNMSETQKQKVAVIEFSDLDGKVSELGKFISEELITRLFLTRRFNVVERQLLNKILAEHKLNVSGIVDPSTAKELGKLLGVDAICSGTFTDLITSIKINARLISTETGSLFAVASTNIKHDEVTYKLMGKGAYNHSGSSGTADRGKKEVPKELPKKVLPAGSVVYFEDFTKVKEGRLPEGWIGGDTLVVARAQTLFRKKYALQPFKPGRHFFTIPGFDFPDSFKLGVEMINHNRNAEIQFALGNLRFGLKAAYTAPFGYGGSQSGYILLGDAKYAITDQKAKGNYLPLFDEKTLVVLEKRGDVFRLFVNGKQVCLIREPNFGETGTLSFAYSGSGGKDAAFEIFKIAMYSL